ncbi:MAG: hypothetical protein EWM45_05425 [Rhodopseudomonas palustris]|nr:MAG: hypothetical protein EWM45_05425 [Rhodopseudomonas palustris]
MMVDAASAFTSSSSSAATARSATANKATGKPAVTEQSPEEKFLAFAKKTPAEKMRDALLSQLGLTEEKLKAMPFEERQKVEKKITEMVKEAAEKQATKTGQTGFITDRRV